MIFWFSSSTKLFLIFSSLNFCSCMLCLLSRIISPFLPSSTIVQGTDHALSSVQLLSCVQLLATPWITACEASLSSVQSLSRVWFLATPWIAARQASLSLTNSRSSLRLTSIESVMSTSHLILCHPLLLLPPIPPSIRVFSSESTPHMRWPKYWSFSFIIIPSKENPRLIFRMDWLDLLVVQGTLKSLLQHYNWKTSIFRCSTFIRVQLSHP